MQAIVVDRWGSSPDLRQVPDPVRRPGFSLVRMHAATVGHLDATIASGNFAVHPELPYIPGVEGAGTVLESDTWTAGEKVVVRGAGVGVVSNGTWCEIAEVPNQALASAPVGMPLDLAASYFVPTTTAYVALHDVCHVGEGAWVAVSGASGAVGSMAVQLALQAGAKVVALTRSPESWNGPNSDRLKVVSPDDGIALAAERQVDALIETVAGPALGSRLAEVAPGGTCALVGYASAPTVSIAVPNLILSDVAIVPVNMLRRDERAHEVAGALAAKLVAGDLVLSTTTYAPSEAIQAQAAVARGSLGGRAVFDFAEA